MQRVDNLRLLLGLKLRALRQGQGLGLKELAARTGLSVSYLSEIESGKKYPKPEKLLDLGTALGVPYDELVSPRVSEPLGPLEALLQAPLLQEFPFELFGLDARELLELMAEAPAKAGALMRALVDIGRTYDVAVEHFLLAALRSYQQMNANYFAELETAAIACRRQRGWPAHEPLGELALREVLERDHGYRIDDTTLATDPDLRTLRSAYREPGPGEPGPTLFVNPGLLPPQRAFLFAREIGYQHLGPSERAVSSSWLEVTSFEQVLSNFKASYFAGALLLDGATVEAALRRFFRRRSWDAGAFIALIDRFAVTPEMFFYRLTELVPQAFGLPEIYFLRLVHPAGSDRYELDKVFNLSRAPVPYGTGFDETYCRRWVATAALRDLEAVQRPAGRRRRLPPSQPAAEEPMVVRAQREHFVEAGTAFFVVGVARKLAIDPPGASAVSLGFLLDASFRQAVRFADDPALVDVTVNLTCERCSLAPAECDLRAAPPVRFERQRAHERRKAALDALLGR